MWRSSSCCSGPANQIQSFRRLQPPTSGPWRQAESRVWGSAFHFRFVLVKLQDFAYTNSQSRQQSGHVDLDLWTIARSLLRIISNTTLGYIMAARRRLLSLLKSAIVPSIGRRGDAVLGGAGTEQGCRLCGGRNLCRQLCRHGLNCLNGVETNFLKPFQHRYDDLLLQFFPKKSPEIADFLRPRSVRIR